MAITDFLFDPESKKVRDAIRKHALEALSSAEGRSAVVRIFADENLGAGLRDAVSELQSELEKAINRKTASAKRAVLQSASNELTEQMKAQGEAFLNEFKLNLSTHVDHVVRREARALALEAVKDFIGHDPIYEAGMSNREIARANRISIREVKRRRRRGTLDG